MPKLKVTQVRSQIGQSQRHRGTLRALGLGKIGRAARARGEPGSSRVCSGKVRHLVRVEDAT